MTTMKDKGETFKKRGTDKRSALDGMHSQTQNEGEQTKRLVKVVG